MSEVNADGVLLNPHEALLQEVQALSNSLMAEKPEGMEDDKEHTVPTPRQRRKPGRDRGGHPPHAHGHGGAARQA